MAVVVSGILREIILREIGKGPPLCSKTHSARFRENLILIDIHCAIVRLGHSRSLGCCLCESYPVQFNWLPNLAESDPERGKTESKQSSRKTNAQGKVL